MSTFTQIYYHIVFSTKNRESILIKNQREDLFKYIWGILKNKKCILYRINAVEDHIHILSSLHPSISLSDLIRFLKTSTASWIKKNNVFPYFHNWQEGYGAFSISHEAKGNVIEYIIGQEEHHKKDCPPGLSALPPTPGAIIVYLLRRYFVICGQVSACPHVYLNHKKTDLN